jgi:hypothetical protein
MGIVKKYEIFPPHLKFDRVPLADVLTIPEQQGWNRDKSYRKKTQQAVSPTKSKRLVHFRSSKWKQGSEEAAQCSHAGDSGCGELWKAINHVCLKWRKNAHQTEAEGDERDDGYNPVNFILSAPTIPKKMLMTKVD